MYRILKLMVCIHLFSYLTIFSATPNNSNTHNFGSPAQLIQTYENLKYQAPDQCLIDAYTGAITTYTPKKIHALSFYQHPDSHDTIAHVANPEALTYISNYCQPEIFTLKNIIGYNVIHALAARACINDIN